MAIEKIFTNTMYSSIIAGIDEAGRGCLAGPVVAAAVILPINIEDICPPDIYICIADSKKLSEKQREKAYAWLIENVDYGQGQSSAEVIDEIGIKKANHSAMKNALAQLKTKPTQVLVDGNDGFTFDIPSTDIIKGDEKEKCISAASIIAKVWRDQYMKKADTKYPQYGFASHKGYGTKAHISNIEKYGVCPLHRKSYQPIPKILFQESMF